MEEERREVCLAVTSMSFSSSDSRRTFLLRGLIESTKDRMLVFVAGESVFAVRKSRANLGGTPDGLLVESAVADALVIRPPPLLLLFIFFSSIEFICVSCSYFWTSRSIDIKSAASGSWLPLVASASLALPISAGNAGLECVRVAECARLAMSAQKARLRR